MNVTFLGTGGWLPRKGGDSACLLIDGVHLVDTGWYTIQRMTELGFDPAKLRTVCFSHLHQDHYLGLPALLFWFAMKGAYGPSTGAPPLIIAGPAGRLEPVLASALEFLQVKRYPELALTLDVRPLRPGDALECGRHRIETTAARHTTGKGAPEEALSFKIHDDTGTKFVYTGDTHPHPPLAEFAKDTPLLIHDAAHTPAAEAARIAHAARARRLMLIHNDPEARPRALAEAQALFPGAEYAPEGGTLAL